MTLQYGYILVLTMITFTLQAQLEAIEKELESEKARYTEAMTQFVNQSGNSPTYAFEAIMAKIDSAQAELETKKVTSVIRELRDENDSVRRQLVEIGILKFPKLKSDFESLGEQFKNDFSRAEKDWGRKNNWDFEAALRDFQGKNKAFSDWRWEAKREQISLQIENTRRDLDQRMKLLISFYPLSEDLLKDVSNAEKNGNLK